MDDGPSIRIIFMSFATRDATSGIESEDIMEHWLSFISGTNLISIQKQLWRWYCLVTPASSIDTIVDKVIAAKTLSLEESITIFFS